MCVYKCVSVMHVVDVRVCECVSEVYVFVCVNVSVVCVVHVCM